jgi:predicted metal-dependent hydrolase
VPGRSERPRDESQGDGASGSYFPAERWAEHEHYLWGADLYNAGFFWEAHEAWETAWRAAQHDATQHVFLQGLIQCAAACLKGVLADADAARRISDRALARLERVIEHARAEHGRYMGLELASFCAAFRSFAACDPTRVADRPALILG